ncbi:sterile alpha motif domain-containing protein 13-like isoform X2 [Alosa pseudoharengus]|uniref:sterile alpha motif domain-containing protein 13-like isoform X2 n=1 Tax=Alosa pseudoharengus TaxID=34774 RepID=UPI003F8B8B81
MLLMDEPSDQKQSSVKMPADLLASDSKESADMENKTNGSVETKNTVENGQFPDPSEWAVTDVVDYFKAAGFEEQADAFKDQEIDGKSLLLMTRNDVLTGLSIKLGPALKIYEYHVKPLQTQHLKTNAA